MRLPRRTTRASSVPPLARTRTLTEITATTAAALVGLHPSITLRDLYDQLVGPPRSPPPPDITRDALRRSLFHAVVDGARPRGEYPPAGAMKWRRDLDAAITASAGGRLVPEDGRRTIWIGYLVSQFAFQQRWRRRGTPPPETLAAIQWTLWLAAAPRALVSVLSDNVISHFIVDADPTEQERLVEAAHDLARRVLEKSAPAFDALPQAPPAAPLPDDTDALVRQLRTSRAETVAARNALVRAETLADQCAGVLRDRIAGGNGVTVDGITLVHSARTGRLTDFAE